MKIMLGYGTLGLIVRVSHVTHAFYSYLLPNILNLFTNEIINDPYNGT